MHLLAFVNRVESDIITPALDRRFGVNQVSLLCHRSELGLATDIAGVCRSLHLPASVVTLAADTQPLALRQQLAALAQGAVAFNISAASPVQAALAYDLARERQLPLMSIAPHSDRLIWLLGGEHTGLRTGSDIADGLTLAAYFALYGSRIEHIHYRLAQRPQRLEALAAGLAALAAQRPAALSLLNRLCNDLDTRQYSRHPLPRGERALRHWLASCGLVEVDQAGHVRCHDASVRFFLGGGWLEVWLLSQVAALQPALPISDAAVGVKVVHDGVANEYDVAILCNNQLYLVECKTTAPTALHQRGIGLDNLFKLDSAASLGGLHAHAMLATLYPATDSEAARAQAQGIALLSGPALARAQPVLRQWLHTG